MIEPFDTKENLDTNNFINESIGTTKNNPYLKMIFPFSIILITIILGIIISILSISNFEKDKIEIICQYIVKYKNERVQLISPEYNLSNALITFYYNNILDNCNYSKTFEKAGILEIKYIINKQLNMENMFKDIKNLISINISSNISPDNDNSDDVGGYLSGSFYNTFSGCENLQSFYFKINVKDQIDMSYMFSNCKNLRTVIFNNDIKNVTNTNYMFENCKNLELIEFNGNFTTSQYIDMSYMFYNNQKLSNVSSIKNFNNSKVTNMSHMFDNCESLYDLDLSNFDTSLITDMSYMFSNCIKIKSIDISSFDISNVNDMSYMFFNCYNLKDLNVNNNSKPKEGVNDDHAFEYCPIDNPWKN